MMQEVRNTIAIGFNKQAKPTTLQWRNSNGLLIAGIPGSGKSQTAAFYLTQYAYNGAKILLCDYNAAMGVSETLLDRVPHLEPSWYNHIPPAVTTQGIIDMIRYVKTIGDNRYAGIDTDYTPLIFVIDEFPAFLLDHIPSETVITKVSGDKRTDEGEQKTVEKQNKFIHELISSILKFRKVNIKYMIIGQEFSQMGTSGVRVLRSNITDKILHRMDDTQASLFGLTSVTQQRLIGTLKTGQIMYNDAVLRVPLLTDANIEQYRRKYYKGITITSPASIQQPYVMTPQDKQFLQEMLDKYQPIIDKRLNDAYERGMNAALKRIPLQTQDDLIHVLLRMGKSSNWIEQQLRGSAKTLRAKIQDVKSKIESGDISGSKAIDGESE